MDELSSMALTVHDPALLVKLFYHLCKNASAILCEFRILKNIRRSLISITNLRKITEQFESTGLKDMPSANERKGTKPQRIEEIVTVAVNR